MTLEYLFPHFATLMWMELDRSHFSVGSGGLRDSGLYTMI